MNSIQLVYRARMFSKQKSIFLSYLGIFTFHSLISPFLNRNPSIAVIIQHENDQLVPI